MHLPDDISRTATVHWEGDVAKGHGSIATGSGKISAEYSFGTRFSGDPGTNPEELLGAAEAACFTMALSAGLTREGHPPTSIDTTAKVHLHHENNTFEVSLIELTTIAIVPGLESDEFQKAVHIAKETCPISKALHATKLALQATLKHS